ncbi:hypothetical protein AV530_009761 [Patagioenas fasciata monilis]|uniref:Uncharacterized protein n=1 Tax=Patagioenas fasciata monilis TaxID=372326 RepID=A0A1V4K9X9_PATFA|nr:hypothetical protein AV530_009761 [Patagioenas fasciata monilis]
MRTASHCSCKHHFNSCSCYTKDQTKASGLSPTLMTTEWLRVTAHFIIWKHSVHSCPISDSLAGHLNRFPSWSSQTGLSIDFGKLRVVSSTSEVCLV